ncbi:MAG: hypothetical protein H7841_18000 [Magnetospirillum sp. WYHS-4]
MFREKIKKWLDRPSPDRAVFSQSDFPATLSSDIGLMRTENQDRVAAMRVSPGGSSKPFLVVALADGMGGMRDGAICASITISSFFFGLVKFRGFPLHKRLEDSAQLANDDVFSFSGSKGGATLSAIVFMPDESPVFVNVGDSRIYGEFEEGQEIDLCRLTTDDSMEEAVGGVGKDLLQFIGMGHGLQPHVGLLGRQFHRTIITSDGVHFLNHDTLAAIVANSSDNKQLCERLAALVRWSGAPDNASIAAISHSSVAQTLLANEEASLRIWDQAGALDFLWLSSDLPEPVHEPEHLRSPSNVDQAAKPSQMKPTKAKPKKSKAKKPSSPNSQFEIEILKR